MRWKKNSGRAVRVDATGLRKLVEMTMVVENVLFFDPEMEKGGMGVSGGGRVLCSEKIEQPKAAPTMEAGQNFCYPRPPDLPALSSNCFRQCSRRSETRFSSPLSDGS